MNPGDTISARSQYEPGFAFQFVSHFDARHLATLEDDEAELPVGDGMRKIAELEIHAAVGGHRPCIGTASVVARRQPAVGV